MVLGKLPVPGHPTILITVRQGPTQLAVGAGGGCLDIFTLICPFSPLSPSLLEMARYRLKYCLKEPLNPKQPTKSPMDYFKVDMNAKLSPSIIINLSQIYFKVDMNAKLSPSIIINLSQIYFKVDMNAKLSSSIIINLSQIFIVPLPLLPLGKH